MSERAQWVEDPRTFCVRVSRRHFRELPLRFILIPTLDAPRLVFSDRDAPQAEVLKARIEEYRSAFFRASREGQRRLAIAVRKPHLTRVALAVGYSWPGNPPGYIEFAPDIDAAP
jgi:hypothetical protein